MWLINDYVSIYHKVIHFYHFLYCYLWGGVMSSRKWQDKLELGALCQEKFIDISNTPEIESLGILLSGISTMVGSFLLERVNPDNHTLIYTIEGEGKLTTSTGEYRIENKSLLILPAHSPFLIELASERWKQVWFNLADNTHWHEQCKNQPVLAFCQRGLSVYHALSLLYYEYNTNARGNALTQLLFYLNESLDGRLENTTIHEVNRLDALYQRVKNQLHVSWCVNDLCKIAYYSAPHLHRLCRQRFGRSPLQQIIFLRIERAKYLLTYTSLAIAQIAEQVGYHEVANFSKRFKKSVGISPAQYKKKVLRSLTNQ